MTIQELKSAFVYAYNYEPDSIYFVPGSINLIGEHIDYLNTSERLLTLTSGIYLLLRKNDDRSIKFWSLNEPEAISLELKLLSIPLDKSWIQYPASVFAQYKKFGVQIEDGLDILIWGNISKNTNIFSPDALKVITAYALDDQFGVNFIQTVFDEIGQKEKYELAFIDFGIREYLDGEDRLQFYKYHSHINVTQKESLSTEGSEMRIIISNTHLPHKLEAASYFQKISESKVAIDYMNRIRPQQDSNALTDEEFDSMVSAIDNPVAIKSVYHMISEVHIAKQAIKAIQNGDLIWFGQLMNASHISLRDNLEIVTPEVDAMVAEALEIEGVIGSRMIGCGFGGSTISLVKEEAITAFVNRLGAVYEEKTGIKIHFYIAKIGDCGCKLI